MHIHHEAAHRWYGSIGRYNWATCPITENGFVRIASNPRYPNRPGNVSAVLAILRRFDQNIPVSVIQGGKEALEFIES
jgi:predicted nucleic acid-binding protein